MKKYNIIITIVASLFIFVDCWSRLGPDLSYETSRKTVKNLLYWYLNTPVKEDFTYQTPQATSQFMQFAIDKARIVYVSN